MLQLSLVCSVGFGMLSAASVSYTMLAITRTLTGVALSGLSLIVLPLGECGGSWQAVGGKGIVLQEGLGRNRAWEVAAGAISLGNIPLVRIQEVAVSPMNIYQSTQKCSSHLSALLLQQTYPIPVGHHQ